MTRFLLLLQSVLIGTTLAACSPHDYETVFGGYEDVNQAESAVFDIDPNTNDIVVGGSIEAAGVNQGLLYYIDDAFCRIKWVINMPTFDLGVRDVHFNSNYDKVVGVAEGEGGALQFFTVNLSSLAYDTYST